MIVIPYVVIIAFDNVLTHTFWLYPLETPYGQMTGIGLPEKGQPYKVISNKIN